MRTLKITRPNTHPMGIPWMTAAIHNMARVNRYNRYLLRSAAHGTWFDVTERSKAYVAP